MVLRPTQSSAVTMATIHLRIQIWLFLFIPQVTYLHTKIEEGLKFFISNFASLSWRTALNYLQQQT